MSIQKQIRKNVMRQNDKLLNSYGGQTPLDLLRSSPKQKSLFADMARNGIKPMDLVNEYERGKREAYELTAPAVQKVCYACFAIVLAECGLKPEEIYHVVLEADRKTFMTIDHNEIIAEMEEKARIRFYEREGVERVVLIDGQQTDG